MRRGAALGLWLALLTACPALPVESGGTPFPGPPPGGAAQAGLAGQEAEAHRLVNAHRATRGLPPLAYDERIAAIARDHSRAMAAGSRPFGHDGFEARSAGIARVVPLRSAAENVAYDSRRPPAPAVVEGWIGSAGHRRNIEGAFTTTGIGAALAADGTVFVTQIFVAAR